MKKFVFSLEKVLSLRQKELDMVSREYMECMQRLQQLKDQHQHLLNQAKACEVKRETSLQHSVSSQVLQAMRFKEESLKLCIQDILLKISTTETQAQYLLTRRQAKKREVNGLEKLCEKQKLAYDAEIAKHTESSIEALFNYTNHNKKM